MSCQLREAIETEIRARENRISGKAATAGDSNMVEILRAVLAAGEGDVVPLREARTEPMLCSECEWMLDNEEEE